MATKIIAIINNKGGVAKTTTTVNVGAALANMGYKTLLVDLDNQANLSQSLGVDQQQQTSYDVFTKKTTISPAQVSEKLFVLPSQSELSDVEQLLVTEFEREKVLKKSLEEVKEEYDFILLDCPPSKGLIVINALVACTDILIPLQSEYLAMQGVASLTDLVLKVKQSLNPTVRILGIIITRYDKRKILNQSIVEEIQQHFPMFETYIRENVAIAEAPTEHLDIFKYAPKSYGAEDYQKLTLEIVKKYG